MIIYDKIVLSNFKKQYTMKKITLFFILFIIITACGNEPKKEVEAEIITTYYLIRHAEKDRSNPSDRDPALSEEGLKRAQNWNTYFKDVDFDMVYSTDYKRTKQTAQPIAKRIGKEISIYDPKNMASDEFMTATKGKTVLVVGHSNTTPVLANKLAGENKYEMIADNNNSNLYIITLNDSGILSELKVVN